MLDPEEEFHVVRFQQMAKAAMAEIYSEGRSRSLSEEPDFIFRRFCCESDLRKMRGTLLHRQLETAAKEKGAAYLHAQLAAVDPKAAQEIHANNVKRVIRALEFYEQTGERISEHNERERQKESPYQFCYFVLNDKRECLYDRIDKRVDQMIQTGL